MNLIKQLYKGESLSFSLVFPNDYDMARIESHSIWIGEQKFVGVPNGQAIELFLKSSETKNIAGVQKLFLWLDDSTFGVKQYDLGSLDFVQTKATDSNDSINLGFNVLVTLSITETAITVENVLYNYFKGADGNGIESIALISTVGLVKTYRITYTDATTFDYEVKDGDKGEKGDKGDKGDAGTDANVTPDLIGELIETTELITVTDNTKIAVSDSAFLKYVKGLSIYTYIKSKLDLIYQPLKSVLELYVTQGEKDTWNGKQSAIGFTPENAANKQNSLALDGTGIKYPTVDAVKTLNDPIATYIHSGNKEVYISAVDTTGNTFTSVAHGLVNGNNIYPVFQDNLGGSYATAVLAGGMETIKTYPGYYVVNKTNDTFQISLTSGGAAIDLTTNASLDLTKWHFEEGAGADNYVFQNIPSLKRVKLVLNGRVKRPSSALGVSLNGLTFVPNPDSLINSNSLNYAIDGNLWGNIYTYCELIIDSTKLLSININGSKWNQNTISANAFTNLKFDSIRTESTLAGLTITSIELKNGGLANGSIIKIYRA